MPVCACVCLGVLCLRCAILAKCRRLTQEILLRGLGVLRTTMKLTGRPDLDENTHKNSQIITHIKCIDNEFVNKYYCWFSLVLFSVCHSIIWSGETVYVVVAQELGSWYLLGFDTKTGGLHQHFIVNPVLCELNIELKCITLTRKNKCQSPCVVLWLCLCMYTGVCLQLCLHYALRQHLFFYFF